MTQVGRVTRALKELRKLSELFVIELIEDRIDQWEVVMQYPGEKVIKFQVSHHLGESLPPKFLVIFPSTISYVCFAELGSAHWKPEHDLVSVFLAIYNE